MNKFPSKFINFIFHHPVFVILVTAVIFIASAVILPFLHIDNSVDVFFNKKGSAYINFQEWKKQFGSDEVIIVALRTDDIFTVQNLSLIADLTEKFESLDYVDNVTSLSTVNTVIGRDQDFIVEHLIEETPDDLKELAGLKEIAVNDPLYVKNVISEKIDPDNCQV